jgi:hypothetical protein
VIARRHGKPDASGRAGVGAPTDRVRENGVRVRVPIRRCVALVAAAVGLAGCGSAVVATTTTTTTTTSEDPLPQGTPHAIQPTAGQQAAAYTATDPVGDIHAHPPSLASVKADLRRQHVYAPVTNASYINPLPDVTRWERTDQGVDAVMRVGSPIVAPCRVKILDIEPDWYAGQPLVYFELLEGGYAGQVQYVAEQITDIAPPGSILDQGQVIARYAKTGTAIEYGWSTLSGITLAVATTGYEEGQITPAGRSMRSWLNALGAGAGPDT